MNFTPLFRSLHSSLFIAFHYLPSPFITFYHPFCFTHPSFTHHCLRSFVLLPFFTPFVLLPPLFLLSPIVLRPLFYFFPLCFTLSHCFTPLCFTLSHCLHPPSLYLLPLFCTRFFTPRQPPQTRPRHRKRQRFSHFSKKFCKKPLTKQKKVLY